MEYIIEQIEWYDVIAFQTTWTYEVAENIKKLLFKHKFRQPKIIVECVSGEPTWYYLPEEMANEHEIYNFNDMAEDLDGMEDWGFDKLRKDKATWED